MKIKLINPRGKRLVKQNASRFRSPAIGLCAIAAVTPKEFEVVIEDEMVENIDFEEKVDLVGITGITASINRAYQISREFRKRGIPVVIGGIHASAMPEETLQHADAVVIGEGEIIWQKILEDLKQGKVKGIYKADRFHDMKGLSAPNMSLVKNPQKFPINQFIETTRGCPFNCEFCSASAFWGNKYRSRPVDEVIEIVKKYDRKKPVFFLDDNIAQNQKYGMELFEKLIPLKIRWGGQTGVRTAANEKLLELAEKSGCGYFFVGFESLSEGSLNDVGKKQNKPEDFVNIIKTFHKHNILILAAFVFGFDNDEPDIFQKVDDFIQKSKVDAMQFNILYPYPGTEIRRRLIAENRLTSNDWDNYLFDGVNFIPVKMTQEELHKGYVELLRKNTTIWRIFLRSWRYLIRLKFLNAFYVILLNMGTRRHYQFVKNNINQGNNTIRKMNVSK